MIKQKLTKPNTNQERMKFLKGCFQSTHKIAGKDKEKRSQEACTCLPIKNHFNFTTAYTSFTLATPTKTVIIEKNVILFATGCILVIELRVD